MPDKVSLNSKSMVIAKNTMYLYIRSILLLFIGLYTSRVVLDQLGISDFGIYNVVGGVILLFSFIQSAMQSATSRFYTVELGKGDFDQINKTFSLSVIIHFITALIIFVLCQTIGLWFLNTQLVIPDDRIGVVNFIYQLSIFSACIGILQAPYAVAVIAHERMKVFAGIGIISAFLNLFIAISLKFSNNDKLVLYSILIFLVSVVSITIYRVYCHKRLPDTHFKFFWDKKLFYERITFSSWTTLHGIAAVIALQGVNFLLNIFFGVALNATYGIMIQVSSKMNQFAHNFIAAINPQLTKSYARQDNEYMQNLLFHSIKFSFLISFFIAVPLVLNMDFVLNLWLKEVPIYAVPFCQIRIIDWVIWMLVTPLYTVIIATGKIKQFIIIDSILIFMNFALTYMFFRLDYPPLSVPIIYLSINVLRAIFYVYVSKKLINLPLNRYIYKVCLKLLIVVSISLPLPILLSFYTEKWNAFFITTTCFIVMFLFSSIKFALGRSEKEKIILLLKNSFIST